VGFDQQGQLTRSTNGAAMMGIITRMACIEGSTPDAAERHLFDTVVSFVSCASPLRVIKVDMIVLHS